MTGVCSTKNIALVKSLGADEVIDYTLRDFAQEDKTYDLIFDTVAKTSMKAWIGLLKPEGKYLLTEFGRSHILAALFNSFRQRKVIIASSNFYWKREDLAFLKHIPMWSWATRQAMWPFPSADCKRTFRYEKLRKDQRFHSGD